MEDGNKEKAPFADNRSLLGLAVLGLLVLFGAGSTVAEWIPPSEHRSVRESVRALGEAVESEYGILSAAEDSSAPADTTAAPDSPSNETSDEK